MKLVSGISALLLGVLAILMSVGLQTVWAEPEEVTASTQELDDAPLTVITSGVSNETGLAYTLRGEGEFSLMLGQSRDVEAWIADAAHNVILGVDDSGEEAFIATEHVDGEQEIPDPRDSDLWIEVQDVSEEVTQRWAAPSQGEWSLLVVGPEGEVAPTDLSMTWINEDTVSPWATPLLILGIILILIGLALLMWLFLEFRKKAKKPSGRRVKGRTPPPGAGSTAVGATEASAPNVGSDSSSSSEPHPEPGQPEVTGQVQESPSSSEELDDNSNTNSGNRGANSMDQGTDDSPSPGESPFLKRVIATVIGLGLAIGSGVGAAHADTSEEPSVNQTEHEASQEASPQAEPLESQASAVEDDLENQDDQAEEVTPVVVSTQLENILARIAEDVEAADDAADAEALGDRIGSQARIIRTENYRNREINDEISPIPAVPADAVVSAWMEPDESFPRSMLVISQNTGEDVPQLLVLEQETAREQYTLIHNTSLVSGAELPADELTDTEVAELVPSQDSVGELTAQEALEIVTEFLTDPESSEGDSVAENAVIDAIHAAQEAESEAIEAENGEVTYSRSLFDETRAWEIPDGSMIVTGVANASSVYTPEEGGEVNIGDVAAELDEDNEGSTYTESVRVRYREKIALHVTPEGEISLIGYLTGLSTAGQP